MFVLGISDIVNHRSKISVGTQLHDFGSAQLREYPWFALLGHPITHLLAISFVLNVSPLYLVVRDGVVARGFRTAEVVMEVVSAGDRDFNQLRAWPHDDVQLL